MERRLAPGPAAVLAAVMLVATFGAGMLGVAITDRTESTASWWPAAGVGVLTLMTLPRTWWRWLVPALTLAYLLANWFQDRSLEASTWLALADVVETILVAWVLHDRMGRRMVTVTDFGWFLGVSLGGAMLAALGVATTSARLLGGEFGPTLADTAASHWASVMLIAPLGLAPYRRIRGSRALIGLQVVLLLTATLLAFSPDHRLTLGFAPLPFLIWAGVSFGYQVVAIEQVVLSVMVTTMTLLDRGPFAAPTEAGYQVAQLYLVSLVIAGLPLALAVGEQREATANARTENRRTEAIIDTSTTPIIVTDARGTVLSVNPATTRLTGFTAEELEGRPFWERLLPPETWEAAWHRFGDPESFAESGEGVILTAAGGERIVSYSTGVLVNPDESVHYVVTATDITAERASSHFLQHLLSSATTIAILGTDQNGDLTLVNAGAERMLRIARDDAAGRSFLEFLDPAEIAERGLEYGGLDGFAALIHEAHAGGVPQTRDWTWLPPDGVPLRVSMTSSLVADARQRPIGYLFVARDVTETRRNQELLHQALEREQAAVGHLRALDHAKDDFVSTVSHELRTPLTSIIGSIEFLGDGVGGGLDPEQRHLVDVIGRNAERLLALANDLLLMSAFENNAPHPPLVPVDLREVVTASSMTVTPLLAHRRLVVGNHVPDGPVTVLGDAGYLERAVTNLLTNAIKFTPDGGSIVTSLHADLAVHRAVLSVADSGMGIPADEVAGVFQRFFRSSNVRADAIQGTGLGLAIVRSIVESHQGRIDVTSEHGSGTTFTMSLPLVPGVSSG